MIALRSVISLLRFSILLLLAALLIQLLRLPYPANASFEEDYRGYLQTYDAYRAAHGAYLTTRNQYLQYGTLNSQNDALSAVKTFLSLRDDVLLSHLSLLRSRNVDPFLVPQLDDGDKFLQTHKSKVPAIGSLDDAVNFSNEVEEKDLYFQSISKKTLATMLVSKVENQKLRFLLLENEATELIGKLRIENKDVATLERWLIDAKTKQSLAEDKINQIHSTISTIDGRSADQIGSSFSEVQKNILEANQYVREGLQYLNELLESMRYGNF
jgi:hypothetical protein